MLFKILWVWFIDNQELESMNQYSVLYILSLLSVPMYSLLILGSQRKSLTFYINSLSTGFISFRISQISMALVVATIIVRAKDQILIGISLEIQESVFLPFLKSKMPHQYSPLDLFSRLFLKQYKLLESWRMVDFLKSSTSFSGQLRSKAEMISLIEQMIWVLLGLKISCFMGWSVSFTILLLPYQRQLIENFLQLWWYLENRRDQPRESIKPVNSAFELD